MTQILPSRRSRHRERTTYAARARAGRRHGILPLEALEGRTLLSVTFTPGPYVVPPNTTDTALGFLGAANPVEAQVTVDPKDPGQIVASSQNVSAVSTDDGRTFQPAQSFPLANSGGDTSTVYDAQGNLYWTNLDGNNNVAPTMVQVNPLTGTVGTPHAVVNSPIQNDKALTATDGTNLYAVWDQYNPGLTIVLARSTDQGVTWSAPVTVSGSGEGYDWPSSVSVAADGTVYVAYHSVPVYGNSNSGQVFVAAYSNDLSQQISKTNAFGQGGSVYRGSYPGATLPPSGGFGGSIGAAGPWVLADPARSGSVYVVSIDDPSAGGAGDPADVVFARLTDYGVTWTTSTIDSGPNNSFQIFPTAAIDKFGDIVVAWYDNRNGGTSASSSNSLLDIYAKYSTDGGYSWSPDFEVNDTNNRYDPQNARPGDYFGINVFGGTAYLAWTGNSWSNVDLFGNPTPDNAGNPPVVTGQQAWMGSFSLNGTISINGDEGGTVNNDAITLKTIAGNPQYFQVLVNNQREYTGLWSSLKGGINDIQAGGGTNTINIQDLPAGVTFDIESRGIDTVTIGKSGNVGDILGSIQVNNQVSGGTTLNIDDSLDAQGQTFTLNAGGSSDIGGGDVAIQGLGEVDFLQDGIAALNVTGGSAGNAFVVNGTGSFFTTNLNTGAGDDSVSVHSTSGPLNINGTDGRDSVTIGDAIYGVQGISGAVYVSNTVGYTHLTLDDSADSVSQPTGLSGATAVTIDSGAVTDLAPAVIRYRQFDLSALTIDGGSGGNTFVINSTPVYDEDPTVNRLVTTLNSGAGADTVTVRGTNGPTNVDGQSGRDSVTIGNDFDGVQSILGEVTVTNPSFYTDLTIDDRTDPTAQPGADKGQPSVVISEGAVTGLAPAPIYYQQLDLGSLSVLGGDHGNTFTVANTPFHIGLTLDTRLSTGLGDDTVTVLATTGPLIVNGDAGQDVVVIGNAVNGVQSIIGDVTIANRAGSTDLTLDDRANRFARSAVIVDEAAVTGLARATIGYQQDDLSSLAIDGGSGGNTFTFANTPINSSVLLMTTLNSGAGIDAVTVLATTGLLTVNTQSGTDTVNAGDATNRLDGIQGTLTVDGQGGAAALNVNDQGAFAIPNYTVTAGAVTRTGAAEIDYSSLAALVLNTGFAGNTTDVQDTAIGTPVTINTGAGNNTVNAGATGDELIGILDLTVNGGAAGATTLNLDDQANRDRFNDSSILGPITIQTSPTYVVTSQSVVRSDALTITVLATGQVSNETDVGTYHYNNVAALNLNGGSSGNSFDIQSTAATTPLTVNAPINDAVTISSPSITLDGIQGAVLINGGGKVNLNVDDFNNTVGHTFTLTADSASSTLARSGAAPITYSGISALQFTGGRGDDTFNVESISYFTAVYGGGGNDTFVISPVAHDLDNLPSASHNLSGLPTYLIIHGTGPGPTGGTANVIVDDQANAAGAAWSLTGSSLERVRGSGPSAISTVIYFDSLSKLMINAGAGDDAFTATSPLTTTAFAVAVTLDGGGGTNALTVDDRAEAAVQTYGITFNSVTRTGAAPLGYLNFAALTLYTGSAGNLIGVASTAAGTTTNVYGGAGNDEFVVTGNSTLDGILGPLNLHGGGGPDDSMEFSDALNPVGHIYTLTAGALTRSGIAPITFDPMVELILYASASGGADQVNVRSVAAGMFAPIVLGTGSTLIMGSLAPRRSGGTLAGILGPVRAQSYGGQTASVIIDDSGDAVSHPQASFQTDAYGYTLTGLSPATIYFQLDPASSVKIRGGTGNDTFTVADALPGSRITVDGGGGTNSLIGPNTANTWTISGLDRGKLDGVSFSSFANLAGGSAVDSFQFSPAGQITGTIDGGGGGDWLDYSRVRSAVTVNLATGVATAVGGGISNIQNVRGGSRGNRLTGNALGNILVGGAGADVLIGGNGRSLLIGGGGNDTIKGGSGDDILIGGTTDFDARDDALQSILMEWQRTDRTYAQRIADLKNGGGLSGGNKLIYGKTVHDDGGSDVLTGGPGLDWFFKGRRDRITDLQAGEQVN